jgi:hypothetical protein
MITVIYTNTGQQAKIRPEDFAATVTPWFPMSEYPGSAAQLLTALIDEAQQALNTDAYAGEALEFLGLVVKYV